MWAALFKRYWLVATFRETPANTPHSYLIFAIVVFIFTCLVYFQWTLMNIRHQVTFFAAIFVVLILFLSYACYVYILLYSFQKISRFLQVLTCCLMAYSIIHFLASPLVWLSYAVITHKISIETLMYINTLYLLLTLLLTIWQFLAMAHIFRHALDVDYTKGILASFGLMAFNLLTYSLMRFS